jgi:hypothetical protein
MLRRDKECKYTREVIRDKEAIVRDRERRSDKNCEA